MKQQNGKRMLGNVELAVHGSSARRPELTEALKGAIARSESLAGMLIIAYPHHTDAVLITPGGAVIAIVLHEDAKEDSCHRHDLTFNAVYTKLQRSEDLRERRDLEVAIQTLGVHSGIKEANPGDAEHPLVNISQAGGKLEELAREPHRKADPETVRSQLLHQNTGA